MKHLRRRNIWRVWSYCSTAPQSNFIKHFPYKSCTTKYFADWKDFCCFWNFIKLLVCQLVFTLRPTSVWKLRPVHHWSPWCPTLRWNFYARSGAGASLRFNRRRATAAPNSPCDLPDCGGGRGGLWVVRSVPPQQHLRDTVEWAVVTFFCDIKVQLRSTNRSLKNKRVEFLLRPCSIVTRSHKNSTWNTKKWMEKL